MELTFPYHKTSRSMKYGNNAQSYHMDRIQHLVDVRSLINVIGSSTLQQFMSNSQGMPTPQYFTRATQLNMTGVGKGAAKCVKEVQKKSQVTFAEQNPTVEQFRANIAEGSGEHLPAILGLKA
eukprot:267741-Karenia_brevis.AAC.1